MKARFCVAIVMSVGGSLLAGESGEGVRDIVAHIDAAAQAKPKKSGDALADHLIREAARFSRDRKVPPRDFLLALGVAFDTGGFLKTHPITRKTFAPLVPDDRPSLGEPTLRMRNDWLRHFTASAALTAAFDAERAEWFGIAKELHDAIGESGFSFADLAADYAGIAFARRLLADDRALAWLADDFRGDRFLPPINDLEERLSITQFAERYGGPGDDRFHKIRSAIQKRIAEHDKNR